jgi:hypothetical protein
MGLALTSGTDTNLIGFCYYCHWHLSDGLIALTGAAGTALMGLCPY